MMKWRTELCLTQADVAAKVKVGRPREQECQLSAVAYAMYDRDEVDPALKTIEQIAAALSVAPSWLALGNQLHAVER